MKWVKIKELIIESPSWRTVFAFLIPIGTGILSGTFVTEITVNGEISWKIFYKSTSFYGLIALSFCMYFYNKAVFLFEQKISHFSDETYCTAYVRSKCLPEAAERYKELIRTGNYGELTQAMNELKEVLK